MSPPATLPVLIIGSGLGGLTLAHALTAQRIPYRIFERDTAHSSRAQGYRISIDEGGASGLKSALSHTSGLFEKFESTCAEQHPPGGRIEARSGKLQAKGLLGLVGAGGIGMLVELAGRVIGRKFGMGTWVDWGRYAVSFGESCNLLFIDRTGKRMSLIDCLVHNSNPSIPPVVVPQEATKSYQVDRQVLRDLLRSSLPSSDLITHSAQFQSYTLSPDSSSIIAHFNNGTSVTGSLLVGADGIRSNVAKQLIGDETIPLDMEARIIYGKTLLTPELDGQLHETLRKGTSFVVDPIAGQGDGMVGKGLLLVHECMRFHLKDSPPNYSFWALAGRKEIFEKAENDISTSSSSSTTSSIPPSEIAIHLTKDWHPSIRILMTNQIPSQTAFLKMTTSSPSGTPHWVTNSRVTVLGDAIHCMPPTGGQGANTALHDAALLGLILGKAKTDGMAEDQWSKDVIQMYEDGMRKNVGDVVGLACIAAKGIMGAIVPS